MISETCFQRTFIWILNPENYQKFLLPTVKSVVHFVGTGDTGEKQTSLAGEFVNLQPMKLHLLLFKISLIFLINFNLTFFSPHFCASAKVWPDVCRLSSYRVARCFLISLLLANLCWFNKKLAFFHQNGI